MSSSSAQVPSKEPEWRFEPKATALILCIAACNVSDRPGRFRQILVLTN